MSGGTRASRRGGTAWKTSTAIALRLLLNGSGPGCETFAALRGDINRGPLAAHVGGCDACGAVLETVARS